jgi:hypothetical protein
MLASLAFDGVSGHRNSQCFADDTLFAYHLDLTTPD